MNNKLRFITMTALLAACTFLMTWIPKLPIPATSGGYVHLGDAVIVAASMLLGPWAGALCGGIGSAFADLAGGYAIYILPTFLIKGIMGILLGSLGRCDCMAKRVLGFVAAGIVMVGGYYVTEGILYQNWIAPLAGIGFNVLQYGVGVLIGLPLYHLLKKVRKNPR